MHFKCKIISEKKKMFCCWLEEAKEQVCSSVFLCVCVCVLFVDGLVFCFFIVFPTFLLIPHTIHRFTYNFEKKKFIVFLGLFFFSLIFFLCVCVVAVVYLRLKFSFQPSVSLNDTTYKFIGSWTQNQDARVNKKKIILHHSCIPFCPGFRNQRLFHLPNKTQSLTCTRSLYNRSAISAKDSEKSCLFVFFYTQKKNENRSSSYSCHVFLFFTLSQFSAQSARHTSRKFSRFLVCLFFVFLSIDVKNQKIWSVQD